jgi:cytochrome c peroxidase
MGRTHYCLAGTALLTVLAIGCRKDDPAPEDESGGGPTPMTVALPSWVIDSIGPMPIPADNPQTMEGVALGRKLFYDKALSDDYSMNCGSCHKQANGFSDPLAFSVGTDGSVGTRNAMADIDLAWSGNLFWDGRRHSLEGQAHDPVANPIEMRNTWPVVVTRLQADPAYPPLFAAAFGSEAIDSTRALKAIAQFERTLVSFGSPFDRYYYGGDTGAISTEAKLGLAIFTANNCNGCHRIGLFTDNELRNNGLDDVPVDSGLAGVTGLASDYGKFKVPTLRNIATSAPYMHDSRFPTLFDVVTFYGGHVRENSPNLDHNMNVILNRPDPNFTEDEKNQLLAFLASLTDDDFLNNAAFGQP